MSDANNPADDFAVVAGAPRSDDLAAIGRLREALSRAGFTSTGVRDYLGEAAARALSRDQAAPALRALGRHHDRGTAGALSALIRLFLLARPVAEAALEEALGDAVAEDLLRLGLAERCDPGRVRSLVDLDLHSADDGMELWVTADLTAFQRPGALRHDYVLGIGGASLTLAQITERRPAGRALDIGTGCGVQIFHLLGHCDRVVATDLSERALAFARFNLILNAPALGLDPEHLGDRVELRHGSLLEPVAGERFDLVVTNPPFVITPRAEGETAEQRYTYRDGGRPGDALVAELIGGLGAVMSPGATVHLLANWEIGEREAGEDDDLDPGRRWWHRVRAWIPVELDAWVIQRDAETPEEYAETWLRDASEHLDRAAYESAYIAYLEDFASRGVHSVGFGYVRLQRPAAPREPRRRFEELTHPVQQPIAGTLAETAEREEVLEGLGERWSDLHLVVPEHVTEERHQRPGAEDPSVILLRQGSGLQRTNVLTSATAGLVGACDGELSVAQIVAALGSLLGWESPASSAEEGRAVLAETRQLLVDGFLEPEA
ncbi:methyltransferase [Kocuria coralli]|uniref:Methyltransferase n=1 Tax=Kocuria coralli TaxID=1461025 RepID=A0A5J5L273_9MICC|nr:methyltransferase [Kocuria coralli]KAA9395305.1 methyltransferase [Kocuria coralli]